VVEKEVVEQIFKPSKKVEAVEEQEVKQPFSKTAKKAIETEEAVEQAPIPEVELVGATAMETLPKIAKKSKPMVKKKIEKSSNSEQKNEVEVKKERQNVIDVEDVITKEKEVTNQEL
jgi:uroporphyrinogen-III decarboxylase